MYKKLYIFCLLLVFAISAKAQQYYPHVLGYVAGEQEEHNGTAVGDTFKVSFSDGAPFADTWKSALPNGTNFALSGMRYDLMYVKNTFDEELFVSKGYFGDFIELKWDIVRYAAEITGFRVFRKELGTTQDSVQIANVPSDNRSWKDEYAESGIMYQYFLMAEGIFPVYRKMMNYVDGVGFRVPYGRISGRVTYAGGSAVPGVSIIAETEDNFGGSSIYMNGTDAYLSVSPTLNDPMFQLDTEFTFQAWLKSDANAVSGTVFEKGNQYKLTHTTNQLTFSAGTQDLVINFPEKVDTFFHVTAMRTTDSIKVIVMYDEQIFFVAKEQLNVATPLNNNEITLGKSTTGEFYKGWIDEVRFWHTSFTEEVAMRDASLYISGTEDFLSGYYRFNEGVGNAFYDLSRQGFSFNANDGYKHFSAVWDNTNIPFSRQLAVKGVTDSNGNYIIAGIPYTTDGSVYRFVPIYGVHSFDPTEQLLFIGPGATAHSNIDFIDVASFPVTGEVYYKNTNYPVEGVSIKIDGQTAVTSEGTPIVTNSVGKFVIDVPIGQHFIQLDKYGHSFTNNARFPATDGEFFDFQQPYTFQTRFEDETLIKVVGKIVGGPVQAAKAKGLGKTTNNLGNAKIILGTQKSYDLTDITPAGVTGVWENESYQNTTLVDKGDTQYTIIGTSPKQIEIEPDPVTGEFFAYLLPEKYKIQSITAGTYTYPVEFHTTLDLTNAHFFTTEIDSVVSGTIITPIGDTITNYRVDSVQYRQNLDLIYRVLPDVSVTAEDGSIAFWETAVTAKDGTQVDVVDGSGTPLTQFPIFMQRKQYNLKVSVFEQYINSNTAFIDNVPVSDGRVEITNALATNDARTDFQISKLGVVSYRFVAGLPNTVGDFTNSMSIVAYTGNGGTIQTPWIYSQALPNIYVGPFKAYVFGGLPTGSNFVTSGPSKADMIIRDPYGSGSYSYYEEGQSTSSTSTYDVGGSSEVMTNLTVQMGAKVKTWAGVGAGTIIEAEITADASVGMTTSSSWLTNNSSTSTSTSTKRWQTSSEINFVGSQGDIFIGHSTNIVYGISNFVDLIPATDCLECIPGVGTYEIGIHKALRVNPEFGTAFQYSQNHIKNYLIPNLKLLRDIYLQNSVYHTSNFPLGDASYGSLNLADLIFTTDFTNSADSIISYTGDSYSFTLNIPSNWTSTKAQFIDSVQYYNEQVKSWEQLLAQNEKEKIEATLINNYSFDAGVEYESSATISEVSSVTNTYEFSIAPSISGELGGDIMGIGLKTEFSETKKSTKTNSDGTETNSTVTFGYVLSDSDVGDYFSIDIKKPQTNTGPVFGIRGGQSSCPFEDAELTEYYQPGTILSEATMQREFPLIACEEPVQVNVPEDQQAIFDVQLRNATQTGDNAWFMVSIDDQTNQEGAVIRMDGTPINNGRVIFVPGGQTVNKIITVQKTQPAINDYEDIGIILHSVCQFDPSDNIPEISDTISITARFKPVCSAVEITNPQDLWVINTNTGTDLSIGIDNYNLAHTGFEKVLVQYKSSSSSAWSSDMIYYLNQTDYDAAPAPKELINGAPSLNYIFGMNSLQDRSYDIRLKTTCAAGTENSSVI